jgi:hypothetical protein
LKGHHFLQADWGNLYIIRIKQESSWKNSAEIRPQQSNLHARCLMKVLMGFAWVYILTKAKLVVAAMGFFQSKPHRLTTKAPHLW